MLLATVPRHSSCCVSRRSTQSHHLLSFALPPCSVEEHGFNISAPHIHATALETLDLSAGDRWVRGSPFLLECHRQHL